MTRSSTSGRCRDVCLLAGDAGHGHRRVSRLSRYLFFVGLARSHAGPSLRRRRPDAAVAPAVAGSVRAERTAGTAPIGRVRTESTRKNTVKKKGNKSTCSPHALQFSDSVMQSRNTCHKIYVKKKLVIRRKKIRLLARSRDPTWVIFSQDLNLLVAHTTAPARRSAVADEVSHKNAPSHAAPLLRRSRTSR